MEALYKAEEWTRRKGVACIPYGVDIGRTILLKHSVSPAWLLFLEHWTFEGKRERPEDHGWTGHTARRDGSSAGEGPVALIVGNESNSSKSYESR